MNSTIVLLLLFTSFVAYFVLAEFACKWFDNHDYEHNFIMFLATVCPIWHVKYAVKFITDGDFVKLMTEIKDKYFTFKKLN